MPHLHATSLTVSTENAPRSHGTAPPHQHNWNNTKALQWNILLMDSTRVLGGWIGGYQHVATSFRQAVRPTNIACGLSQLLRQFNATTHPLADAYSHAHANLTHQKHLCISSSPLRCTSPYVDSTSGAAAVSSARSSRFFAIVSIDRKLNRQRHTRPRQSNTPIFRRENKSKGFV